MTRRNSVGLLVALPLMFVTSLSAQTQAAQSFEQLQVLVKPGDKIYVRDSTGNVSKGRVVGLTPTALDLMTKSGARELAETDIVDIKQWRHDSVGNGAGSGAVAGGVIGIIGAAAICGDFGHCAGPAAAMIALFSGLGAGVGVGLDALIPEKQIIYTGNGRAINRFKVSPVLGHSRKGVAVAFSF